MSDVGRKFRVTRMLCLEFALTADDVADQDASGETVDDTVKLIAGSAPQSEWTMCDQFVEEV